MMRFPWRRDAHEAGPAKPQGDSNGDGDDSPSGMQPGSPREESAAEPAVPWAGAVRGERAAPIVSGARSLQSRMSSLLAAGLMISVGAGMLAWYYAEALSRPAAARTATRAALPEAAGEGMTLPPFGPVTSPPIARSTVAASSATSVSTTVAIPPSAAGAPSPMAALPPAPMLEPPLDRAPAGLPRGYGPSPPLSPRQQALARRLSGEVFAGGGSGLSPNVAAGGMSAVPMPADGPREDALQRMLRPGVLSATRAQILPTQRLLLPKGTFIDCTLETAIDSTLPGLTTCVTATDTFGADGMVVLFERGTKLIGETRGQVQQGVARVFVVWTEARTPSGVVVRLDSPGTDQLGRSGLEGHVNRHFWQRFGAAALVSTIDGVVQSEVESSSRGGTVVLDPTASEDVLTDILRSTVNIPPTIRVRNGARIQVLVARDLDFRPVYELVPR